MADLSREACAWLATQSPVAGKLSVGRPQVLGAGGSGAPLARGAVGGNAMDGTAVQWRCGKVNIFWLPIFCCFFVVVVFLIIVIHPTRIQMTIASPAVSKFCISTSIFLVDIVYGVDI